MNNMNSVSLSRSWNSSEVWPVCDGSIENWPVWAARDLVAVVAGWKNTGWFYEGDSLLLENGVEDFGGGLEAIVRPRGSAGRRAGPEWQAALEAVIAAHRA
jgi:hypothetical protein